MKGNVTYAKLQKKYEGMNAITYRIKIDGVEITEKFKCDIGEITVDLTSTTKASGCEFMVIHEYEPEKTSFKAKSVYDKLQPGAKVEIALGYITTTTVFKGYINQVNYRFNKQMGPHIVVSAVDAKCLLMKTRRLEILSEKTIDKAIKFLLGEKPFSGYIDGKEIEVSTLECEMVRFPEESDYDFIVRYAEYTGMEFFIVEGKVYYRKIPTAKSDIMLLEKGKGLLEANMSMGMQKLVEKVVVKGINPENGQEIVGNYKLAGKFSKAATSKKALGGSITTVFDPMVKSAKEAGDRAKLIGDNIKKDFMVLAGVCEGIPELVPGRTVTIKGFDPLIDKTWYIENVRHTIDERGYRTVIQGRKDTM